MRLRPMGAARPQAAEPDGALPSSGSIAAALESCVGFSLIATDLDGIVRLWSEGARHLYGYERAEIVGRPSTLLHGAEDLVRGLPAEMLDGALRDGGWAGSAGGMRKDGGRFTARVSVSPLLRECGSPEGFLFVSSDMSEEERLAGELALERQAERMLFETSGDAMIVTDGTGTILRVNGAAEELFGYDRSELIDCPVETLMPARYRDGHVRERGGFAAAPYSRPMAAGLEIVGQRRDGSEVPLEIRLTPQESAGGPVVMVELRDVTEQRRVERELADAHRRAAESLALLEAIQSAAPVGIGFVDRDFRVRNLNATLAAIHGSPPEQLIGLTVAEALPERWTEIEPMYRRILETGEPVMNVSAQGSDAGHPGQVRSWLVSYYPVTVDREVIGIGQVVLDVTDTRRADDLRAAVMQNMAEGLCVIDRDGRLVLMNAAASSILGWTHEELLGKPLRAVLHRGQLDGTPDAEEDSIPGLFGTDETGAHSGEDAFTANDGRIVPVAYSASPLIEGSASHGAVVVFRDATEEHAQRERASRELEALSWVGRIRDALDEDRLVLHSQPIVPLTGGTPRVELLLRMVGHRGELIPPGRFLPAAEQYGLIVDIDRWVIGQAIALAAEGRIVQVNLSAQSVADRGLLADIQQQLRATGADPHNLVFELTETALMDDIEVGERFVNGLTELGCAVALDDFGTGFGSFTYLKRLPVKILKIDMEFVRNLATSVSDQHLVKGIVNLAQGLDKRTIAEGVEDERTLELIREYGVDFAQGFHLGRPAPLEPS